MESETLQVEHTILLKLDTQLEALITKVVDKWWQLSLHGLQSMRVVAYAASACLLCWGASKLLIMASAKKDDDESKE